MKENFRHMPLVQNILDSVTATALRNKWIVSYRSTKAIYAFTRAHSDSRISMSVGIQWLEVKALLSVDFNFWLNSDHDHVDIDIKRDEADYLNSLIERNIVDDWTKSGLEIPDVEIDEAA